MYEAVCQSTCNKEDGKYNPEALSILSGMGKKNLLDTNFV